MIDAGEAPSGGFGIAEVHCPGECSLLRRNLPDAAVGGVISENAKLSGLALPAIRGVAVSAHRVGSHVGNFGAYEMFLAVSNPGHAQGRMDARSLYSLKFVG